MRYLVISDTHGQTEDAKKLIRYFKGQIDGVLHLGDLVRDFEQLEREFQTDPSLTFAGVPGNCDGAYNAFGKRMQKERVFTVEGRTFLLTHGDRYQVGYGLSSLKYRALEAHANVVLFGHTHVPLLVEEEEILFLNPGSLSLPRGGSKKGFALLEVEKGKAAASLLNLEMFSL